MTRFVPTPISTALRGALFVVGGLACFAAVIATALFAFGMTLVLVGRRPLAAVKRRVRAETEPHFEAAPVP
ncbi:MAG TPA: hypothetical protein VF066_01090 [Thermoleophilaceae bacterium]